MKYLLSLSLGAAMLAGLCLTSCGTRSAEHTESVAEENKMVLTEQDTTATLGLVKEFMDHMVAGEKDAAVAMLYAVDYDDFDQEPYQINDRQLEEMDLMLSVPVKRYEIADYVFSTPEQNEVRCRVYVSDNVSTSWYFKPVRYLGKWYLCLKDSSQGDRSLGDKSSEIAI